MALCVILILVSCLIKDKFSKDYSILMNSSVFFTAMRLNFNEFYGIVLFIPSFICCVYEHCNCNVIQLKQRLCDDKLPFVHNTTFLCLPGCCIKTSKTSPYFRHFFFFFFLEKSTNSR